MYQLLQAAPIATPTIIPGLGNVRDLAFIDSTAFALLSDGTVFAWGGSSYVHTPAFVPTRIPNIAGVTDINGGDFTGLDLLLSDGRLIKGYNGKFSEVSALPIRKILNVNGLGGLYLLRDGRAVFNSSGGEDYTNFFR